MAAADFGASVKAQSEQRRVARRARRRRGLAGTTLAVVGMAGAAGAQAQCVSSNGAVFAGGNAFVPFGTGTALSSFVATLNTVDTIALGQSSAFVSQPANDGSQQQAGGAWARTLGGTVNSKSTSSTVVQQDGSSTRCNVQNHQDFAGTQAGFDIGKLNIGGWNLQFGATAGFIDVWAKDKTPNEQSFSGQTQASFAGGYMSLTSGAFALDAMVRKTFFDSTLSDVRQGLFDQHLNARSTTVMSSASYRFKLAEKWFLEPSVGGIWSSTEVDPLAVSGTATLVNLFNNNNFTPPGSVKVDDITSIVGRATVKLTGQVDTPDVIWFPFVSASVFREFAGQVKAEITAPQSFNPLFGPFPAFNASSTSSRVGTFGHVGVGVAGAIVNSNWIGYARADYEAGANIEAFSFNLGMRYQFGAPPKAAGLKDSAPTKSFDWTGLYVGANFGTNWGQQDWKYLDDGVPSSSRLRGYIAGGQAGYNYQMGALVVGVEGDIGATNAKGARGIPVDTTVFATNFFATEQANVNILANLTARFGVSWDRALFYVKGGVASGEVMAGMSLNIGAQSSTDSVFPRISETKWQTGWTAGGGVEYALSNAWTARAEYMHYDLGSETFKVFSNVNGSNLAGTVRAKTAGDTVRVGVNYLIGRKDEGLTDTSSITSGAYKWSGVYLGAHAGQAWSNIKATDVTSPFGGWFSPDVGSTFKFDPDGVLAGGHLGIMQQYGRWVVGGEISMSNGNLRQTITSPYFPDTDSEKASIANLFTATARLGYAFNNVLVYGKAGYANGEVNFSASQPDTFQNCANFGQTCSNLDLKQSQRQGGYTVGAGLEYGLTKNITLGVEYNYVDLGKVKGQGVDSFGDTENFVTKADVQSVTGRLNFLVGK